MSRYGGPSAYSEGWFVAGAKDPPHDDASGETMPAASGAVVDKVAESGGASPVVEEGFDSVTRYEDASAESDGR
jgi:hypothetical protein